jgi:hypothetical protein
MTMKRGLLILVLGLAAGWAAFYCLYRMGTATPRALLQSPQPELAWLKHEFKLDDAEFQRIAALHAGYQPRCRARCEQIERLNDRLSAALTDAAHLTPELEKLLGERAQMRATCQAEMLKHFFEVSRAMPPEQGRRYLAWAREHTCLSEAGMDHGQENRTAKATPVGHP